MKLIDLKTALSDMESITFRLPNGNKVPAHFHVTEIGQIDKKFIDCGGTIREEKRISLQLWTSIDLHHRLKADTFSKIIQLSEEKLGIENYEIEVEYQGDTIQKFGLDVKNGEFILTTKKTACLAEDLCGIPTFKEIKDKTMKMVEIATPSGCCGSEKGCC